MNNPLVSVILPTYNRSQFIEKAIRSVWTQTYAELELVVINDGSKDDTADILDRLSQEDSRITVIQMEKNSGIVAALNEGGLAAKGTYIARLDDDDFWSDDKKIEKQVNFLENNKEYVLVGGGVIRVDKDGKEIDRFLLPEKDEDIRKSILVDNVFVHTTVLFRKDAFEKTGGYNQEFLYVEDWELWMHMGTMGKLYNFQEFFVTYLDQEAGNKNYYRNWGIRRNIKMSMSLKKKYRDKYPGYAKAAAVSWTSYIYSFLPLKKQLRPGLVNLRNRVVKSPYKK